MMAVASRPLQFPGRVGLGTWRLGESSAHFDRDVGAVAYALDIGYRLVDTAEQYADGGAECVIGSALNSYGRSRRGELFIVSKVSADNASATGVVRACEASIERMGCEYLDLYLLHWPGAIPFIDTLRGFAALMQRNLIRNFGVSNLGVGELQRWLRAERSLGLQTTLRCNQMPYSAELRGFESVLQPWQRARGIQTMAYWPLGRDSQAGLTRHPLLQQLGHARGATAAQVALAWCVRDPDVVAIPKSTTHSRLQENLRAAELRLSAQEIRQIDQAFPIRFRRLRQVLWLSQLRSRLRRIARRGD